MLTCFDWWEKTPWTKSGLLLWRGQEEGEDHRVSVSIPYERKLGGIGDRMRQDPCWYLRAGLTDRMLWGIACWCTPWVGEMRERTGREEAYAYPARCDSREGVLAAWGRAETLWETRQRMGMVASWIQGSVLPRTFGEGKMAVR